MFLFLAYHLLHDTDGIAFIIIKEHLRHLLHFWAVQLFPVNVENF